MRHIEFLGPPGAGKSTICERLRAREEYYGGIDEGAVARWMLDRTTGTRRLAYRVSPRLVRSVLEARIIEPRLRRRAFDAFVRDFPGFLRVLAGVLRDAALKPDQLYRMLKAKAEAYRLGASTLRDGETLCLDSGFYQRIVAIRWRFDGRPFDLADYVESTPTPAVLVSVDAPVDVCLRRQETRGAVTAAKEWADGDPETVQADLHEWCHEIAREAERHTTVVNVRNVGNPDETAKTVLNALRDRRRSDD